MQRTSVGEAAHRGDKRAARAEWIALDIAANIFPSTIGKIQRHLYSFVITLRDDVDAALLQQALDAVAPRFPSVVAGLRAGAFWYALEPVRVAPKVTPVSPHPMAPMPPDELRRCCLRVQYEGRRIVAEFFHALCDGGAALVFVKTLIADYISRRYQVEIPCGDGVLDLAEAPSAAELADSYARYAGAHPLKRNFTRSYQLREAAAEGHRLTVSDYAYSEAAVHAAAKALGVSVPVFTTALVVQAMLRLQLEERHKRPLPVRVSVPVNLRRFFPTRTLRNFSLCVTVEIDPLMGDWTLPELCESVYHQMKLRITPKEMAASISTNVALCEYPLFKYLPLWIKSPLMRAGYQACAKRTCCTAVSNMGRVTLPPPMETYVEDVFCSPDANPQSPCSFAVLTYGDRTHIALCTCLREDRVARALEAVLREAGL